MHPAAGAWIVPQVSDPATKFLPRLKRNPIFTNRGENGRLFAVSLGTNGWAVPDVAHEIDDNAGERDIEPNGDGPLGDTFVFIKALLQGWDDCHDDKWHGQNGQWDVG
jgi:hypothetical protein